MVKNYKKAVTFSYDDGVTYDRKLIEIFNKYGIKATFNIITGNHEPAANGGWRTKNGVLVRRNDFLTEEGKKVYDGHEIAVHTRNHPWLRKIDDESLKNEILKNRDDIERIFGEKPVGMAYPFNDYDDRAVKILSDNGFLYAREGRSTHSFDLQGDLLRFCPTCHHNDEKLFELAKKFVDMECDNLKIFYVWGHSYEFEDDGNWDRIEKLCAFLSGREDILFGTNRDVFELQKSIEQHNG